MPLSHAEAVLSLRDDPTLAIMSRDELATEAEILLGDDDPLAIALVVEEAQRLGPSPPPAPLRAGGEGCRLEKDCGGREPVAGNGRCMTCGADRGAAIVSEASVVSDTEAPETPQRAAALPSPVQLPSTPTGPLTARVKLALGATDSELGQLLGVSRPTAQAYASGRLPEIVDAIRAEYLLRAVKKRAELMRQVEAELERIIAVSD